MNLDNSISKQQELSLREISFLLLKHLKLIIFSTLFFLFLCLLYIFTVHPTFQSHGSILIEDPSSDTSNIFDIGLGKTKNFIENETEILKSRTTSDQAIKHLMNSGKKLHILRNKSLDDGFWNFLSSNKSEINQISNDSLVSLISTDLRNSMNIKNARDTDLLKISVQSKNPDEAALLVNTIIEVYKDRDLNWVTGEMQHLKSFLNEQLSIKEEELNEIEEELKNFQESEKLFSIDGNYNLLLNELRAMESKYYNFEAEINILQKRKDFMYNRLSEDERTLAKNLINSINSRLEALRLEIATKEAELISTVNQHSETHSAVQPIKEKIERLKKKLENETNQLIKNGVVVSDPILYRQEIMDSLIKVESYIPNLESRKNEYKKVINQYEVQLSNLPEKVLEFTRLERVRNIQSQTYSFMRQKLEEARINEASKMGKIRIVDGAVPDYIPIKPNKKLFVIASIVFGLFFAILIIGIIEIFDNTIKSVEQIERRGFALLAVIPSIANKDSKKKTRKYISSNNSDKLERRLITHEDPKSPISEAYRGLRTSLMYTKTNDKCRVILVSSSGPGEGKTTTIANLAITYANLGKKVLLIDSDLRKPVMHKVFKLDKSPGVTTFLSGTDTKLSNSINESGVKNLDILTSGVVPPNPSELLDSARFVDMLNNIKEKYDVILFDTPPLIAVTDAFILLKHISNFVLVVRSGVTQKMALDRVITNLAQAGFKETGVVLNDLKESHSYGAGYYYNYYQYYYAEKTSE